MNFDWKDYLTLAQALAKDANEEKTLLKEAKYRAAISRAYYAAFCKARVYLEDVYYLQIPIKDMHNFVIAQYANETDVKRNIGDKLHSLRGKRTKADYHHKFKGNLAHEAQTSLRLAEEIIDLVRTLPRPQ